MPELQSSHLQFKSPPVYETALTVQFEELQEFQTVHFGQFHSLIASCFPVTEDHPRAEPIVERFPKEFASRRLRIVHKTHGPERVWYRDRHDGVLLLQLQPDRLSLNWRKSTDDDSYPRFRENGICFLEALKKFRLFCADKELGELKPNLCEVVYVNFINPDHDAGESVMDCFGSIFAGLEWKQTDTFLPQPEIATFNRVYEIGEQRGRLYAEAGIGRRHPKEGEFVQLKITARILIDTEEEIVSSLQLAHDWVINGFVSLTTIDAQQKRWKRVKP